MNDNEMTSQEMEEQYLRMFEPTLEERMEQMMQRMQQLEERVRVLERRLEHHVDWHREVIMDGHSEPRYLSQIDK